MAIEKRVKAEFAKCSISNRLDVFKQSTCILPISVGQDLSVHEGEKFKATIELITKSFQTCTILIDDSIQRHTLRIHNNESEQILYGKAIQAGDAWLERNIELINKISIPYKIMRWDDWLAHKDFKYQYSSINALYENSSFYRNAYDNTIKNFLKRQILKGNLQGINNNFYDNCLFYLPEECAVMSLWAQKGYNFEVYPSGRNEAMIATYENYIKKNYPSTLISVSLNFKKKIVNNILQNNRINKSNKEKERVE